MKRLWSKLSSACLRKEPASPMSRHHHHPHGDPAAAPGTAPETEAAAGDETTMPVPMEAQAHDAPTPSAAPETPSLEKELAEAREKYLRLAAEYDNYRKRASREMNDIRIMSRAACAQEFLNVFDYFSMAVEQAKAPNASLETLRQGMQMIQNEYKRSLDNLGLTPFDATGRKFDPNEHDAVSQEPSDTVPAGQVLRQWKVGYRMGDRLVRPATVVVSSGPATATPPETPAPESAS